MAYIPGFEHDIFISYAHVDNLTASQKEDGWVDKFHKRLEVRLAKKFGRMELVGIWRDDKLERGQLFDKTIQDALDSSAVFVCLASQGHLASEYCQDEIKWFYEKASGEPEGVAIGDRLRLINCLVDNIPHTDWPEGLAGTTGYPFYDEEEGDDPTDPEVKLFQRQLRDLVEYIYNLLEAFREKCLEEPKEEATETPQTPENGVGVFFADVADSLHTTRKRLMNELQRKGIKIVSGIPPPYEYQAHEAEVKTAFESVALSVHLLDQLPGREIDGEPTTTYPQKQIELARAASVNQLIWAPKELDFQTIDEEDYRKTLDRLENGLREGANYDFVRGRHTDLAHQLLDKIKQLQAASEVSGDVQAALLDTHSKDESYAMELGFYLSENNIQPYINPQEDDPNKHIDAFEARLKQVSILIILFGSVNADWVLQRLGEALKLSITQKLPLKTFCVFGLPPTKQPTELNFSFGPIPVHVIDNSKGGDLQPQLLAPVLKSVTEGGAA